MCTFFCSKRQFNTCVTPGTAQLKSNTLQESITRCVYWQRTQLKRPMEKGWGVLFRELGSKMMENMITAGECEHLLDAPTGSYCENCCRFIFADILKIYTQMNISHKRNHAEQRQWTGAGMMGCREIGLHSHLLYFLGLNYILDNGAAMSRQSKSRRSLRKGLGEVEVCL